MGRTFEYRHIVPLEETNLVGNVYFTNYLRWQGHTRERFLMDRAPGVLRALREDLALVTVSCHCDYFHELYASDTVEVRMSLGGIDGGRVTMLFDYFRVGDPLPQLVAKGSQTIACMRRDGTGMRPVDVPAELADALRPYS
ncbi:enediyne biosynthesis thioesterase [Prauserella shujinwangii]|uniref:Enediyne biosynthesis thioesterase n=1 Tax=Prauserella shujinwangii TaxID=1453103 RepID=A0A2T0LNB8_9PSEU|nr:acyl-CoA thioesterase [Prauserella shujinwangii]PRX44684.1 enediyne biosynthesis thioesterase [Prauserella shujinwangii]